MTTADLIVKLQAAGAELARMCERQWAGKPALNWSIPARPGVDSDLVIGEALSTAIAALRAAQETPPGLAALHRAESWIAAAHSQPLLNEQKSQLRKAGEEISAVIRAWTPPAAPVVAERACPKCKGVGCFEEYEGIITECTRCKGTRVVAPSETHAEEAERHRRLWAAATGR